MQLDEVFDTVPKSGGPETDIYHILKRMINQKGPEMFRGGNAYVLPSKGGRTVYRVWYEDPGYEDWLEYAMANQHNPHVVKILGRMRVIDGIRYRQDPNASLKVLPLERLTEFGDDPAAQNGIEAVGTFLHKFPTGTIDTLSEAEFIKLFLGGDYNTKVRQHPLNVLTHEGAQYLQKYPDFVKTCYELLRRGYTDIQVGNVMKRGSIPVIVDPAA